MQGVGFRPFVYATARRLGLKGYVLNDAAGVEIHLEGEAPETFLEHLKTSLPPLARIDSLVSECVAPQGFDTFEIRASDAHSLKSAAVSADMAICQNCLEELRTPSDRRFGYFLINCTDCGPRYSIVETVPYDRPNTSMRRFEMCAACAREYRNPLDRRYHAQPISCPDCGPVLSYREGEAACEGEQALIRCAEALKRGLIVAVKGLGGFHLMCDATDETAVRKLRERKRRPAKPFAVMAAGREAVHALAKCSEAELALMDSKEKPVVLVRAKPSKIAPSVAPGIDRLGLFLPYTPLQHLLFERIGFPLVATSANLSDEPIVRDETELNTRLLDVVDAVLTHDRDIVNACDDSVMQMLDARPLTLRLARGFAPLTMRLPHKVKQNVLAVGASQKNTIAFAFEDMLVLSPHIGDLGSVEAFDYFERTVETFRRFYDFSPDVIVCDMHPEYESVQWAKAQGKPVLSVQHHHAHILAGMLEYRLDVPVLGFAFDGTGYGPDGTVWGGEVLRCERGEYERLYRLRPFRLIGSERAVREPRRAALGLLFELLPLEKVLTLDSPAVAAFSAEEIRTLHRAWERGLNAPLCSSMGRLFDAVASLAGVVQTLSYEGEGGLMLEAHALDVSDEPFAFEIAEGEIDWRPMLACVLESELSAETIASRWIATVAEMMVRIAVEHPMTVVLGGGVFQNRTLLERVVRRFDEAEIDYRIPSVFPVNDGGIAVGQIAAAIG